MTKKGSSYLNINGPHPQKLVGCAELLKPHQFMPAEDLAQMALIIIKQSKKMILYRKVNKWIYALSSYHLKHLPVGKNLITSCYSSMIVINICSNLNMQKYSFMDLKWYLSIKEQQQ